MARAMSSPVPGSLDMDIVGEIHSVATALARPRERIERTFTDVGARLGDCVRLIRRVADAFDALSADTGGESPSDDIRLHCQRALTLAKGSTGDRSARSGLTRLMEIVRSVEGPIYQLQQTVRLIGLVAVGTRINAAQLTGTTEDFAVFTTDIGRLSDHVGITVKEFAAVHGQLVTTLASADARQARFEIEHAETMTRLVERLRTALETVAESKQSVAGANAEMSAAFRRIAAGISSAVSSLQIGDITRQRIEHVEEALMLLLGTLNDAANDPRETPALIAAVSRLQLAQTNEALGSFDADTGKLRTTLDALAHDATGIVEQSGRIHRAVVDANQRAIASLVGETREACNLIRTGKNTLDECDDAARSVVASLDGLLKCVEAVNEIEADMQIVSLNMGLKCARLGAQGHTLNVISQELRSLTAQTVVHGRSAIRQLQSAAEIATALADHDAGPGLAEVDALEDDVATAVAAQEMINEDLAHTMDQLAADGSQAARCLVEAGAGMRLQDEIGATVRGLATQLAAIQTRAVRDFEADGGLDLGPAEAAALSRYSGKYTMASERAMHERFTGITPTSPSSASPASADEDDLDALFL